MDLIGKRPDFFSGQIILNFLQKRCRRQRAPCQECVTFTTPGVGESIATSMIEGETEKAWKM